MPVFIGRMRQFPTMFSLFWPVHLFFALLRLPFQLLLLLSCLLTLAAYRGDQGWLWSLTTHFRLQYLVIQLIALIWTSLQYWAPWDNHRSALSRWQQWLNIVFLGFFAGLNLWCILPYYWPPSTVADHPPSQSVTLLHFNLFGEENHEVSQVANLIRSYHPDIVDLVEYSPAWQRQLEGTGVFKPYPYRVTQGAHIGLYSKRPLINGHLVFPNGQRVTNQVYILATITLNHQPIQLLVAHPASPIRPSHLGWLQQSFSRWEQNRAHFGKNLIVVGDLNTSPWSVEFNQLIQKMNLRDSQLGLGLQPSWPMLLPKIGIHSYPNWLSSFLKIPIDHVLVSPNIQIISRETGPFSGSDHLPVFIRFGIGVPALPPTHASK